MYTFNDYQYIHFFALMSLTYLLTYLLSYSHTPNLEMLSHLKMSFSQLWPDYTFNTNISFVVNFSKNNFFQQLFTNSPRKINILDLDLIYILFYFKLDFEICLYSSILSQFRDVSQNSC